MTLAGQALSERKREREREGEREKEKKTEREIEKVKEKEENQRKMRIWKSLVLRHFPAARGRSETKLLED